MSENINSQTTLEDINTLYQQVHRFMDFRIEPFCVRVFWNHSPLPATWHEFDAQTQPLGKALDEAVAFVKSKIEVKP